MYKLVLVNLNTLIMCAIAKRVDKTVLKQTSLVLRTGDPFKRVIPVA